MLQKFQRFQVWLIALFVTLLLAVPNPAYAADCANNNGVIAANTTWSTNCTVTNNITVNAGITLTISPGVEVKMGFDYALVVNGTVKAKGSAAKPIRFTSAQSVPKRGNWRNIVFNASSKNNELNYVTLEYGGWLGPMLDIRTSSFLITNSTIQKSDDQGISITDASPLIEATSIVDNDLDAIYQSNSSYPQLNSITVSTNGYNGIHQQGGSITQNYSWSELNRQIDGDLTVAPGVVFTISAGVEVKLGFTHALIVNGTLKAKGSAAKPIRFTSSQSVPTRGSWGNIVFNASSSNNEMEYVRLEYGGSLGPTLDIHTSSLSITNCTIQKSNDQGLKVTDASPIITNNNIFDNDGDGILNSTPQKSVNAACNFWGSATGPTANGNPSGTGQRVSNGVVYEPWLVATSPGAICNGMSPKVYLPIIQR